MGMAVDLKTGESVIAVLDHGGQRSEVRITLERLHTGRGAVGRLVIVAPPAVVLIPPNRQKI